MTGWSADGVAMCNSSMKRSAISPASRAPRCLQPAAVGLHGQDDVLAHAQVGDDALGRAVLGRERDTALDRCGGRVVLHLRAVDLEGAGIGPVEAEDEARQLGPARSQQAGKPHDLALVQVQVERLDRAGEAEPLRPAGTPRR